MASLADGARKSFEEATAENRREFSFKPAERAHPADMQYAETTEQVSAICAAVAQAAALSDDEEEVDEQGRENDRDRRRVSRVSFADDNEPGSDAQKDPEENDRDSEGGSDDEEESNESSGDEDVVGPNRRKSRQSRPLEMKSKEWLRVKSPAFQDWAEQSLYTDELPEPPADLREKPSAELLLRGQGELLRAYTEDVNQLRSQEEDGKLKYHRPGGDDEMTTIVKPDSRANSKERLENPGTAKSQASAAAESALQEAMRMRANEPFLDKSSTIGLLAKQIEGDALRNKANEDGEMQCVDGRTRLQMAAQGADFTEKVAIFDRATKQHEEDIVFGRLARAHTRGL